MSRLLIIRPEAESEIVDAFNWYENHVAGLGSDFLLSVDAIMNAIQRDPSRFPQIHHSVRRALTRRFPYEVLFVEDNERVVVLAVFHAKRNPKRWQERL